MEECAARKGVARMSQPHGAIGQWDLPFAQGPG